MVTKSTSQRARDWLEDKKAAKQPKNFLGEVISAVEHQIDLITRIHWPTDKYQRNPVAFFREILSIDPWVEQVRCLEAIRDHPRVAIKSGHKIGKSNIAAGGSLWQYSSWLDARVVLTSVTARQVNDILWREIRKCVARSGRCLACTVAMYKMAESVSMQQAEMLYPRPCSHSAAIQGKLAERASSGLKAEDFREITGFTAKEAEAVAGISGNRLWYWCDESSGIPQAIFDAIEGNRAGGARAILLGNPTKKTGEFYDAFNAKKHFYFTITVSSETTPNCQANTDDLVPGLANPSWVREKAEEWGVDSAMYRVRILGEFAEFEEGKIFPLALIEESEQRYDDTEAAGLLQIGVDVATSAKGDDSAFSSVRGLKHLDLLRQKGLDEHGHLILILSLVNKRKIHREIPLVVLDREGKEGAKIYGYIRGWLELQEEPKPFRLVGVRTSERARREPDIYNRIRDELASCCQNWMENGGAILSDTKLEAELHKWEWKTALNGKMELYPRKEDLRKSTDQGGLGRSPDSYDSLSMAVWPVAVMDEGGEGEASNTAEEDVEKIMDPYAANEWWRGRS